MKDIWIEIDSLIHEGRTISAIKMYRDEIGATLSEASQAINDRINWLFRDK